MIFKVRFELTSHDLALAAALEAEIEEETRRGRVVRIGALSKTEIREIAKQRVSRQGESDNWPVVEEDGLYDVARERVKKLWPEGA